MIRNVGVFGATGVIGTATLDVISQHPDRFRASVLVAHRNVEALTELCTHHRPDLAIVADPALEFELTRRLSAASVRCDVASGHEAITDAAASGLCDISVAAIMGAAGLDSVLAAARAGKRLLLANKEATVMAGPLLRRALADGGGELIPLNAKHNTIFQHLSARRPDLDKSEVKRLTLTTSGGPLRGRRRADLMTVTPDQVAKHPNWRMGRHISVDSATLMNEGLEAIQAQHLFHASPDQIGVLVHPQRLAHSLIEYVDGSLLTQLGSPDPDIRSTIFGALTWPERVEAGADTLDLASCPPLTFEKPDLETFRCLALAFQALRAGGDAPTLLNAANEVAVEAFLAGSLPFLSIADVVEQVLAELPTQPVVDIQTLSERDQAARGAARRVLRNAC